MTLLSSSFSWGVRTGTNLFCRIDGSELSKIPMRGPLILVFNHINSLEVPLLHAHLQPRRTIGLAKIETWDSKIMGWVFDMWKAIPIRRGEADLEAVRRCLAVLKAGGILGVAPEGTRSYDGKLLDARPGVVLIALHSGAPILPIAHWGGEDFPSNIKRLKRTDFHIRVGKLFTLDARGEKVTADVRKAMVDEIMYQIAILLPEKYRGPYANCNPIPQDHLRFS